MKQDFSDELRFFLKQIKNGKADENQIELLANIIGSLEKATSKQKERFLKYYCSKKNTQQITLTQLAKEEGYTTNAIRISIVKVIAKLVWLDDERKDTLIKIIKYS